MWKVILFAHDFSECAGRVEPLVADLARVLCAKVVVCHVSNIQHGLAPETMIVPPGEETPIRIGDYALRRSRERLQEIERRIERDCAGTQIDARIDELPQGILAAAKDHRADVIVMGTHGRRGLEHLFLGSVAEKVLRQAEVPVITLRTPVRRARPQEEGIIDGIEE
ncbi:MAG: universal stress protein [Polyangiaceae bacterium]